MSIVEIAGLKLLRLSNPEFAHNVAIKALNLGLVPKPKTRVFENLKTSIGGLELDSPIGLAAGFDKNAEAVDPLLKCGFGFVEVGAVTPEGQPGNPKPRLFRLPKDQAVINSFGFNNLGMDIVSSRLAKRAEKGIVGVNLGANKDSDDRIKDYVKVLKCCGPFVDFATVNVSSPNTENLRNLQEKNSLNNLLDQVMTSREKLKNKVPIFLKIAPDLSLNQIDDISEIALKMQIDAVVATNTTLDHQGLKSDVKNKQGGLSGRPLFSKSTWVLANLSRRLEKKVPLIGVGGIASAQDAYAKILAGASAVQLYTGLVYNGIGLVTKINKGLSEILSQQNKTNLSDIVGSEADEFLCV
jgi:dihydroorotate dehydrogenase